MPHLSQTLESYHRIKIYTQMTLVVRTFHSIMEMTGILQFAERTLCPKIRLRTAFSAIYCVLYFPRDYYPVNGVYL